MSNKEEIKYISMNILYDAHSYVFSELFDWMKYGVKIQFQVNEVHPFKDFNSDEETIYLRSKLGIEGFKEFVSQKDIEVQDYYNNTVNRLWESKLRKVLDTVSVINYLEEQLKDQKETLQNLISTNIENEINNTDTVDTRD